MDIDLILDSRSNSKDLAEQGKAAEDLGFSGVWVSSLLDGRDAFTNLVDLARTTKRIFIGVIAVNPWDMHPVKISSALHTLNEISNGRARIVIGGGGEALAALGLKPERRVRAVRECVEIIKQASLGERFDFEGEIYKAKGYGLSWLSAPQPKVYIGANLNQMLTMSASVADGVMFSDLPPRLAKNAIKTVFQAKGMSAELKKDFWFSSFSAWHVYSDVNRAHKEARRWLLLRGLFRPWVLEEFLMPNEVNQVMSNQEVFIDAFVTQSGEIPNNKVPKEVVDKLIKNLTFTAAPDFLDLIKKELLSFKKVGLTSISLRLYEEPIKSMDLLSRKILPIID
ncbi:MAG: LLM class flavin-dependent oxidoreductase [Pseudomonadota bacterium]|nr:LLM class flavin-dependent oxidoreductase [Pseudomonadota bacterium]